MIWGIYERESNWKYKAWLYDKIRRIFWKDYDPNEDFVCGNCGRPVFHRFLFCTESCSRHFNHNTDIRGMDTRNFDMTEDDYDKFSDELQKKTVDKVD